MCVIIFLKCRSAAILDFKNRPKTISLIDGYRDRNRRNVRIQKLRWRHLIYTNEAATVTESARE